MLRLSNKNKINNLQGLTLAEDNYRRKIFEKNLAKINEHNDKFEKDLVSYSMVMNHFGHLTDEEFSKQYGGEYGVLNSKTDKKSVPEYNPKNDTLPASIDWRLYDVVRPVKSQGNCGACYAFAVVAAVECQYYMKYKKFKTFSEQQIIDCGRDHKMNGCSGGRSLYAYNYVRDVGLVEEKKYKYEAKEGSCRIGNNTIEVKLKMVERIKPGSIHDMEAAIAFQGPISINIEILAIQFISGKEVLVGDWCNKSAPQLHSVVIVGYDTSTKGVNYWKIRNSWGENWGYDGYFFVERHKDDTCGLSNVAFIPYIQ